MAWNMEGKAEIEVIITVKVSISVDEGFDSYEHAVQWHKDCDLLELIDFAKTENISVTVKEIPNES